MLANDDPQFTASVVAYPGENELPGSGADQSVIVSKESLDSDEIVQSNIDFINALLESLYRYDELSRDGLRSYFVDYYLAEINNGGFLQFIFNTDWDEGIVRRVREGLQAMGAKKHLALFERAAAKLETPDRERLEETGDGADWISSGDFDREFTFDDDDKAFFEAITDEFFELDRSEDLLELNANWLRSLPNLVVMAPDEIANEISRRAAALPDRAARATQALADEPRYTKLIRALCAAAGHEFSFVTAGERRTYDGQDVIAAHFITDRGHYYMIDVDHDIAGGDGKAIMFDGESHRPIVEIKVSDIDSLDPKRLH